MITDLSSTSPVMVAITSHRRTAKPLCHFEYHSETDTKYTYGVCRGYIQVGIRFGAWAGRLAFLQDDKTHFLSHVGMTEKTS